jgi:hypothetical protein
MGPMLPRNREGRPTSTKAEPASISTAKTSTTSIALVSAAPPSAEAWRELEALSCVFTFPAPEFCEGVRWIFSAPSLGGDTALTGTASEINAATDDAFAKADV